ncbi:MAG: hypothetical protein Q9199_002284 [Rusavskia elegans]
MANPEYSFHFPGLTVTKMTIVDSERLCDDVAEGRKEDVKFGMPLWSFNLLQDPEPSSTRLDGVWQRAVGPGVPIRKAVKIEKSSAGFTAYISHDQMQRAMFHHLKTCTSHMYETSIITTKDSTDSDSVPEGKSTEPSHELQEVDPRGSTDGETDTEDSKASIEADSV